MNRIKTFLAMVLLPMLAAAQTVTSPNGKVKLTFSLTDNGAPTYALTFKDKPVVKPSRLGLELAKDKHASRKMKETDLMDGFKITDTKTSAFDPCGARRPPYATITTNWR